MGEICSNPHFVSCIIPGFIGSTVIQWALRVYCRGGCDHLWEEAQCGWFGGNASKYTVGLSVKRHVVYLTATYEMMPDAAWFPSRHWSTIIVIIICSYWLLCCDNKQINKLIKCSKVTRCEHRPIYGCAWNYSTPLFKSGLLAKFTNWQLNEII